MIYIAELDAGSIENINEMLELAMGEDRTVNTSGVRDITKDAQVEKLFLVEENGTLRLSTNDLGLPSEALDDASLSATIGEEQICQLLESEMDHITTDPKNAAPTEKAPRKISIVSTCNE